MLPTSARLLRILAVLQQRPEWTGPELADRLGVTGRTVRRDVERLRELGYPVDSVPGRAGGYRLGRGTALPPLLLEDGEAVAVAIGLRAAATGSVTGLEDAALTALTRLENLLPARLWKRVQAVHESTVALLAPGEQVDATALVTIAGACRRSVRLRFGYRDREGRETQRLVEPYRLVHTGRRWYLVARDTDRGAWRTFRVDRLADPAATPERFTLAETPDAAALVSNSTAVAPYRHQVTVRLAAPAEVISRKVPPTAGVVEPLDDTACVLRAGAERLEYVLGHLLFLGVDFEVTDPPEDREAVRALAERIATRHAP